MSDRIIFDQSARSLTYNGRSASLQPTPFAALRVIASQSGRPVSYRRLTDRIVGADASDYGGTYGRVAVYKIRLAAQSIDAPDPIVSRWRVGYAISPLVDVVGGDSIIIDRDAIRLVRRLIECCPHAGLAESARQAVFG